MNLLAILAALGLEQWQAFHWRVGLERLFVRYARYLERNLNGGRTDQGMLAMVAALVPPVRDRGRRLLAARPCASAARRRVERRSCSTR